MGKIVCGFSPLSRISPASLVVPDTEVVTYSFMVAMPHQLRSYLGDAGPQTDCADSL